MTKREAAIVTAYTGIFLGDMDEFHKLAEELLERPVWTHQLAEKEVWVEIKEKAKPLFMAIKVEG